MSAVRKLLLPIVLLGGFVVAPCSQAETFHTCGNIIASLPTVLSSQGVYCLSHDLTTAITSGNAITVNINNVTIDCNGFKIGGLAAGVGSQADGIRADARQNITIRNCGIRGFYRGINLNAGAGHLVEDNRLDNNLSVGIQLYGGENNRVQRNRVYDTGGSTFFATDADAIYAQADMIDNTVAGAFSTAVDSSSRGIVMVGSGTEARGNQVRGLVASGAGTVTGIQVYATGVTLDRNRVSATALTPGSGISGNGSTDTFCLGNTVAKFATSISQCQLGSDNLTN